MTRIWCIAGMVFALGATATAQDVSTDDVYACTSVAEDADRLACYDAAVGRLQEAEAAGDVTTVTRKEVEQVRQDSFGFSIPSLPSLMIGKSDKDTSLKEVVLPVKAVRGARGNLVITLENGQVWRQIDSKPLRNNDQTEAQIYEAALGSFKMKLDGGVAFRVERVK
ncbi:hypothetical protein [uncultured Hyphomonas sp.]|uniref:hypothetical protein n=1 Tax=uncultured Hyphomonas sp. TaxID=225298 RepID=UPI001A409B1F|nr:hypothetical protein [Hyphomonas sp.]